MARIPRKRGEWPDWMVKSHNRPGGSEIDYDTFNLQWRGVRPFFYAGLITLTAIISRVVV